MANRINYWWGLPVATAFVGVSVALVLFPKSQSVTLKTEALESITPDISLPVTSKTLSSTEPLMVQTVALPPVPKIEPVQYQARIVKNRVELEANPSRRLPAKQPETKPAARSEAKSVDLEQLATEGEISTDLANRFSQALAEMKADEAKGVQSAQLHPKALTRYPQWYQDLVPALEFSSHIYSSDKDSRWVKVNRQVVKEGELINADLRLIQVTPEQVVIEMQQRQFTLPALTSW